MRSHRKKKAAAAGTVRPIEQIEIARNATTNPALMVRCAACPQAAEPLHGGIAWRLCADCRAALGDAATQPLIVARVTATLAAQRAASARRLA